MLGVFDIVGPVTDEDKKEIHVRTYQQVFPYAELLVKQLCAAGRHGPTSCSCATRWTRSRWL